MRGSFSLILLAGFTSLASAISLQPSLKGVAPHKHVDLPFCLGAYAVNKKNCKKFNFSNVQTPCTELKNCTTFFNIQDLPDQNIDDHTARMARLITSVFENGDTIMGYAYVSALGDGRGYTSGFAGFTTGTNDALAVIKEYTNRKPDNILEKYIPELTRLSKLNFCDKARNDTSGLPNYPSDWVKAACTDPTFVETQVDIVSSMYLKPAINIAGAVGVESNLGKAIFYDTIIEHGWQYTEPLINIYRIIDLTGPKLKDETEQSYLDRFLKTRRQMLCCFPDNVWPFSASRVSDLQYLLKDWAHTKKLENPVYLPAFRRKVTGKEQLDYDTNECPGSKIPKGWKLPKAVDLPIPDVCDDNP